MTICQVSSAACQTYLHSALINLCPEEACTLDTCVLSVRYLTILRCSYQSHLVISYLGTYGRSCQQVLMEIQRVLVCPAAHAKSSTFGCSLDIPITAGRLNLGTWQVGCSPCKSHRFASSSLAGMSDVLHCTSFSSANTRSRKIAEPANLGLMEDAIQCQISTGSATERNCDSHLWVSAELKCLAQALAATAECGMFLQRLISST